eukprot:scaffold567_cov384-Prasinococcus_capsulatus_cf.AAC.7
MASKRWQLAWIACAGIATVLKEHNGRFDSLQARKLTSSKPERNNFKESSRGVNDENLTTSGRVASKGGSTGSKSLRRLYRRFVS